VQNFIRTIRFLDDVVPGEPAMKGLRLHGDSTTLGILFPLLAFDLLLQVLEVSQITGVRDDGRLVDHQDALDVGETGQTSVRPHCVGSEDDPVLVLD